MGRRPRPRVGAAHARVARGVRLRRDPHRPHGLRLRRDRRRRRPGRRHAQRGEAARPARVPARRARAGEGRHADASRSRRWHRRGDGSGLLGVARPRASTSTRAIRSCSRVWARGARGASGDVDDDRAAGRLDRHRRPQRGRTAAAADREPAGARLPRRSAGDHRRVRRLDGPHARWLAPYVALVGARRRAADRAHRGRPARQGRRAERRRVRGTPRRAGLRRCTAALRAATRCGAWSRTSPTRRSARCRASSCSTARWARARPRVGDGVGAYWRYEKWLRAPRERHRLDARRHRRDLRDAPGVLAAAAGRHDSGRRAGADARGARGLAGRLRADGAGVRRHSARRRRRIAAQDADARGQLPGARPRAAAARPGPAIPCGCSTCRTSSGAWSCPGRCSHCSWPARPSRGRRPCTSRRPPPGALLRAGVVRRPSRAPHQPTRRGAGDDRRRPNGRPSMPDRHPRRSRHAGAAAAPPGGRGSHGAQGMSGRERAPHVQRERARDPHAACRRAGEPRTSCRK